MDGLRPGDGPERLTTSGRPGPMSARVQDHQRPHHPARRGAGRAVRLLLGATLLAAGWVVLTSTGSQAAETHGRTLGGLTRALEPVSAPVRQVLGGAGAATAGPSQHPAGPSHLVVGLEPVRGVVHAVTAPALPVVRPVVTSLPTLTGRILPRLIHPSLPRPALLSAPTIPVASQAARSAGPFGPVSGATRAAPLTTLSPGRPPVARAVPRSPGAAGTQPAGALSRPGRPGPGPLPDPVGPVGPVGPVASAARAAAGAAAAAFAVLALTGGGRAFRRRLPRDRRPASITYRPRTRPA